MRCRRFQKELAAWLDGELPEALAAELALHRKECPACAALAARSERAQQAVDALPPVQPGAGFDEAFQRKLLAARNAKAVESARPRRGIFGIPALAGAAALLCVAGLAIVLGRRGQPPPPSARPDPIELARNLELLQSYDVVANLDALEDFDVVKDLGALTEGQR